ncbi:hypothetical protein KC353_g18 [Hortaea werneckii]|nr:hypothetical protein KC353_g18 [Hortaea werneckii]
MHELLVWSPEPPSVEPQILQLKQFFEAILSLNFGARWRPIDRAKTGLRWAVSKNLSVATGMQSTPGLRRVTVSAFAGLSNLASFLSNRACNKEHSVEQNVRVPLRSPIPGHDLMARTNYILSQSDLNETTYENGYDSKI